MSITVGKSVARVDAFDKVTGRTKYYEDRMPAGALYIRIKHAEIAHGFVKSVDTSAAEAIDGVVKVLTCFDVPDIQYPTPGHPWSVEKAHQDVSDRKLLNRRVRIYGDDIAAVVAGCAHGDNARAFIDFLLSSEVQTRMAEQFLRPIRGAGSGDLPPALAYDPYAAGAHQAETLGIWSSLTAEETA